MGPHLRDVKQQKLTMPALEPPCHVPNMSQPQCPICLNELLPGRHAVLIPCGHVYCRTCSEVCRQRRKCAACNATIGQVGRARLSSAKVLHVDLTKDDSDEDTGPAGPGCSTCGHALSRGPCVILDCGHVSCTGCIRSPVGTCSRCRRRFEDTLRGYLS